MKLDGEQVVKKFSKGRSTRTPWEDVWQDIYDLTLPAREGFYAQVAGEERSENIYDETALVALADFVSRMQAGIVPAFSRWFRFEPGPEVNFRQRTQLQSQLDEVSEFVWEVIGNSNFNNEAQEFLTDIAIGWSTMIIEPGRDGKLVNFKTVPQCQTYWLKGPDNRPDCVFRIRENVLIGDLDKIWPGAKISDDLSGKMKGDPDAKTHVIEVSYRDWHDMEQMKYHYQVVATSDKSLIIDDEATGLGARPYVTSRWSVAAGEDYGRGPLVQALPAIRTVNLVTEMVLENAQLAISGLWQLDDDGVINVDNIEIIPGIVYPRPADSRGLERLDVDTRGFQVSDIVIAAQQENIRRALFAQNLGPLDQTPRSATEINARMQDLAEQTSGPSSRLQSEWIEPLLQRVVRILTDAGKIDMPRIDGREVKVVSKSPLARAQRFEDIERIRGFAGDVMGILGPQAAQVFIDQDRVVSDLQSKWEVPAEYVRDEDAREELVSNVSEAVQPQPGGLPEQIPIGQ